MVFALATGASPRMLRDPIARVVEWQTRAFKGRMPKGMGVRVPPRAPFFYKDGVRMMNDDGSAH